MGTIPTGPGDLKFSVARRQTIRFVPLPSLAPFPAFRDMNARWTLGGGQDQFGGKLSGDRAGRALVLPPGHPQVGEVSRLRKGDEPVAVQVEKRAAFE